MAVLSLNKRQVLTVSSSKKIDAAKSGRGGTHDMSNV
jgi:hypothetical protein